MPESLETSSFQRTLLFYNTWRISLFSRLRVLQNWFLPFADIISVVVVVQLLSWVQFFLTPRTTTWQASLSFTITWSLLRFMYIESVMVSNHLILCHPLLFLPSTFPSIWVFSNELALCIRWPKWWSSHFSIIPSSDIINVQGHKVF